MNNNTRTSPRVLLLVGAVAAATLGCGTGGTTTTGSGSSTSSTGGSGGSGGDASGGTGGGGAGCPGQCVPVFSSDWQGSILLWIGKEGETPKCPPTAPVDGPFGYADLNAPNLCGACACDAPPGACTLPTTVTAASSQCPGSAPGVAHTSFDPPPGWGGACTAANPIAAGQKCNGVNCVQSLTIGPLTLTETPCGVSTEPVASNPPPIWGTVALTCRGTAFGPCESSAEVCTPRVVSGFEQCIAQQGDKECPDLYTVKHILYDGVKDTRDCTPCACSAPVGGTCSAAISVFKDSSCTTPVVGSYGIDASGPACLDLIPGVALGSKLATPPVYSPGACQKSGGEPVGQAMPDDPITLCCLP